MPIAHLEKLLLDISPATLPRHEIEVSLRDSLGYIQSILDTLRTPVLILDSELRIRTASRAFYQTFNIKPETSEGALLYALADGAWNIPALRLKLGEVLPLHNSFDDFAIEHEFPVLGKRHMLLNARKLWREKDHTAMMLLVIEDITIRKTAEEELLRSNEDLQRFAYVAAHDLRTPLGAAMSLCEILQGRIKDRLSEVENNLLKTAIKSMKDQNALMDGILSYSVTQSGETRAEKVPLEEPLYIALENLRREIEGTKATVSFENLPETTVDRTPFTLLLQNLIGNAIKYRRHGEAPRIGITASASETELKISIADNGIGFDPADANRIFEPFTRLDAPDTKGSGIGLATCMRIVGRMKGSIRAESVKGKGSVFHITLPLPVV